MMIRKMKHNMMVFMSKRMLSCEEAGFLISRSCEDKLTIKEKFRLRMHLFTCYLCRRYEKQLAQLNKVVQDYKKGCEDPGCQHHLEGEAKVRISRHVDKELHQGS